MHRIERTCILLRWWCDTAHLFQFFGVYLQIWTMFQMLPLRWRDFVAALWFACLCCVSLLASSPVEAPKRLRRHVVVLLHCWCSLSSEVRSATRISLAFRWKILETFLWMDDRLFHNSILFWHWRCFQLVFLFVDTSLFGSVVRYVRLSRIVGFVLS